MEKRILVIGGSAAGPKVASKVRRLDQSAEITIVQKAKHLSMASCGYPYYIGGVFDDRNKLISTPTGVQRDPSFFSKVKDIKALVSTEATAINPDAHTVMVRNLESGYEESLSYDKLVLATGAKPIVPALPGIDLDGISTLQSMEDADYLKAKAREGKVKNAVIVGGGLIGIEACEALALAGVRVTVVEMRAQILPFLDWELAKLVENHIRSKGSEVVVEAAVEEFLGKDGSLSGVRLSNGDLVECDMAVVAVGVKPNADLAAGAGIATGKTGGISVNRFLQTSHPDIYAAGDCIEVTNLITHDRQHWPMGDAANLQGRVVAQNILTGNVQEYEGIVGTGVCKVFDFVAGSTGLSETMAKAEGYTNIITSIYAAPDKPGFMDGKPIVMKLVADKTTGRFLGLQAVGSGDVSKRLAMAAVALHSRVCLSTMVNLDLPYAPPFSSAIDGFVAAIHVLENKWRHLMNGISSVEVRRKLDAGEKPFILDVRGPEEYEAMRLGIGENLIPLGALRSSSDKLPRDKDTEIITFCKISLRGYEAACYLSQKGYTNVRVMEGGIVAWPYPREV
jgi:NADPH-dependent 2,4-dienoyl-CoA reductase/sulfur reductase-like enzyme/rhodanese-related sulfurtransferase